MFHSAHAVKRLLAFNVLHITFKRLNFPNLALRINAKATSYVVEPARTANSLPDTNISVLRGPHSKVKYKNLTGRKRVGINRAVC